MPPPPSCHVQIRHLAGGRPKHKTHQHDHNISDRTRAASDFLSRVRSLSPATYPPTHPPTRLPKKQQKARKSPSPRVQYYDFFLT